jgi:hypothetical protein
MNPLDWQSLESTVAGMSPLEKSRLAEMIELSAQPSVPQQGDPLLGLMAEDSLLLDCVMDDVYATRQDAPLRSAP